MSILNGFLLLDKEKGLNSFKLVMALRRIAGQKRVGYAGTLDPLATGLMIMALGEYTKLLPFLEAKDKTYQVEIMLGKTSDTFDAEGQIEDGPVLSVQPTLAQIGQILISEFTGQLQQFPPRYSAIQIDGKRAYQMARDGVEFEMKARSVEIFSIKVISYDWPLLNLEVHCGSGTYIRSLAHDLGQRLGCGGMVAELRRTAVGILPIDSPKFANLNKKLEQLNRDNLAENFIDPRLLFAGMPMFDLADEQYAVLTRGNFVKNDFALAGEPALAFWKGVLVGVLETVEGREKLKFSRKLNIF